MMQLLTIFKGKTWRRAPGKVNMKKLMMAAAAALVLCGCAQKDDNTLRMITEATFPPYEFRSEEHTSELQSR